MKSRTSIPLLLFLLAPVLTLQGAITVAPPFTNEMVLQRNQPIPIWGRATPGSELHFKLGAAETDATTDPKGDWMATFLAQTASTAPLTLEISGDGTLSLTDILIGDVWVASGQSNMEFPLATAFGSGPGVLDAANEIAAANHPDIHFFHQKRLTSPTPLVQANGTWEVCTPVTVGECSAVAYFFAQDIAAREHVPIGLICTYQGGTPIEAWTPLSALQRAAGYATFGPRWQKFTDAYPKDKIAYDKKVADQNAAIAEAKAKGTPPPPNKYVSPAPGTPSRGPGMIYNACIFPFTGLPITGVIWYQGEDNASHADEYRSFFPAMITAWRQAWSRENLPFLFVQLSSFHPRLPNPGPSGWAELRDAQNAALQSPHTGMAVTLDLGEAANIHYVNKKPVGLRLAEAARALVYGEKIEGSSPLYDSMAPEGSDAIRLKFSHVPAGLKTSDGGPLQGFTMAGDDRVFHPADATVDGSTIVVRSSQVPKPVAVRYAWADNPAANLVGGDGLPVGTFRTDSWDH